MHSKQTKITLGGRKSSSKKGNNNASFQKQQIKSMEMRPLGKIPQYHPLPDIWEAKFVDSSATSNTVSTTGQIVTLNTIAQGTGNGQRIGDELTTTSVIARIAWATLGQVVSADETNVCRSIIFYDKQPNGATPTIGQLLNAGNNVLSAFNDDLRGRFIVLDDWLTSVGLNGPMVKTREVKIPTDLQTLYGTSAGTVAAVNTGLLCLCNISDSGIAPAPNCSYYIRVDYIDN
jgi:hypothetical protein